MNPVDYLNATVWARLAPSPLGGVGVFAIRDIPKGQQITDYWLGKHLPHVLRLTKEDLARLEPGVRNLILDQFMSHADNEVVAFSPNFTASLRCFMNHSATPNTDGMRTLVEIKEGEELTENYTSFGELSAISEKHYATILP